MKWIVIVMAALMHSAMTTPLDAQLIVAHRGASHDAPENTLAAFKLAWEREADAIEGDFRLTADGRVVCIHDEDTERVAGRKLVVAKTNLAELQRLDVGRWKDEKYAGERISTLEEVLAILPKEKQLFMELKAGPEIVAPVQAALADSAVALDQIVIISFDEKTLAEAKRQLRTVKTHWLTGHKQGRLTRKWSPTLNEIMASVRESGADGCGSKAERRRFNAAFLEKLRSAGLREFHVWTVDEAEGARYYSDLGAYGITTNRPDFIRRALDSELKPPRKTP